MGNHGGGGGGGGGGGVFSEKGVLVVLVEVRFKKYIVFNAVYAIPNKISILINTYSFANVEVKQFQIWIPLYAIS